MIRKVVQFKLSRFRNSYELPGTVLSVFAYKPEQWEAGDLTRDNALRPSGSHSHK